MVLLRSDTNDYPLPLLTSVGTLDGGGVSSAVVEWRQSRDNPSGNGQPVLMIEEVNHLQVSDGEPTLPILLCVNVDSMISCQSPCDLSELIGWYMRTKLSNTLGEGLGCTKHYVDVIHRWPLMMRGTLTCPHT